MDDDVAWAWLKRAIRVRTTNEIPSLEGWIQSITRTCNGHDSATKVYVRFPGPAGRGRWYDPHDLIAVEDCTDCGERLDLCGCGSSSGIVRPIGPKEEESVTVAKKHLIPTVEVRASYKCPSCNWVAIVGKTPRVSGEFKCPAHGHVPAPDCEIMAGLNLEVQNTALKLDNDRLSKRVFKLVEDNEALTNQLRRAELGGKAAEQVDIANLRADVNSFRSQRDEAQRERERVRVLAREASQQALRDIERLRADLSAAEEAAEAHAGCERGGHVRAELVHHLQGEIARLGDERDEARLELHNSERQTIARAEGAPWRDMGERLSVWALRGGVLAVVLMVLASAVIVGRAVFFQ